MKRYIYGLFKNRFDIGICYKYFNFIIRLLLLIKVYVVDGQIEN